MSYQGRVLFFEDSRGPSFSEKSPIPHAQRFPTMPFEQELTVKQGNFIPKHSCFLLP